jgi:hypothetical protein
MSEGETREVNKLTGTAAAQGQFDFVEGEYANRT